MKGQAQAGRPFLLTLFFFSGAVGVAYEVVWARQLSLLFGVSIYAVSAVLVAFMGGLGAGAEFFGRKLDKGAAPIRLYAALEMALGVCVMLFPLVLAGLEKLYVAMHPGVEGVSYYVIALRLVLAVAALIIPTTLMGGTLPALARYFVESGKGAGRHTGALYAINTVGAMAGCVAAGFWMIENLGLGNTLRVGAVMNIVIGVVAWALAAEQGWVLEPEKAPRKKSKKKKMEEEPEDHRWKVVLMALFGVSGFCALALEVIWTRLLILLLNNTTYAFSLILAMYLLGIGVGSAVTSRFISKRLAKGGTLFGVFQIGIGFFALVSLVMLAMNQPLINFIDAFVKEGGWLASVIPGGVEMVVAVVFSLIVVFPSTFLMGGSFPLVVEAATSSYQKLGGEVGRLYASNITGCVLGSLLAGYAMIPAIGAQASVIAVSWIAVASGLFLLTVKSSPGFKKAAAFAMIALFIPLTVILFYKKDIVFLLSAQKLDQGSEIEFYKEGPSATVLVSSQATDLSIGRRPLKRIWINGDPIAGVFREALQLERLQAHIPLLLHQDPKDALVICFGTGSTAGAAAAHGLKSVTAVDISTEVFEAGPWFAAGNLDVMNNPALKLVEEDGRNFLLTTARKFDFITSEPPPPSNAGIVSLYTKEFYELCRKKLRDGGIVSQWIPLHHLSEKDFKMLVASFVEVFPSVTMWYTKWDAIMIGSDSEMKIDIKSIGEKMKSPAVAASLKDIGVSNIHQLMSNFMMSRERLLEFTEGIGGVVDDQPVVEFSAPRIHSEGVVVKGANLAALLKYREPPDVDFPSETEKDEFLKYFESEALFLRGQVEMNYGNKSAAASYFNRALKVNSDNANARYAYLSLNLSTLYSAMGQVDARLGLKMLDDTDRMDTQRLFAPQIHFLRGVLLARNDEPHEAERELRRAISLDDNYFLAVVSLAGIYASALDEPEKAKKLYERALGMKSSESEREAIRNAMLKI